MKKLFLLVALAAVAAIVLACSEDKTETPSPATSTATGTAVSGGVVTPSRIKDAGKLVAGSDVSYPPLEFFKEGTQDASGFDYDLGAALAKAMGVQFEISNTPFDGIIPALNAKRFDVIMSAMTDNADRREAIDFVDYLVIGTGFLVPDGNPKNVATMDDLCGLKVSVDLATVQADQVNTQNEKCKADGKPEAEVSTFEKDPDAVAALNAGRTDVHMADYPVVVYYASLPDATLDTLTLQIETAPYGIGVRKDDPELKAALEAALAQLIADGTYDQLLDKWQIKAGDIRNSTP